MTTVRSNVLLFALALAVAGALGLAAASREEARRASCVSTPVAGQPGTAIVTCTKRP
jgi:hypothetical protein